MTPPSLHDEQASKGHIQKTRRAEGWAIVVGLLILLGLFGHLLNQQQASKRAADAGVESPPRESAPAPDAAKTIAPAQQNQRAGNKPDVRKWSQVVYKVTHKHRLRDCHGTLTFTQEGVRFESDEPQDSFAVRLDDVTIEGDALRIRDKSWRFEFDDAVNAERIFHDWKTGTLRPVSAP
jgi:hypothetical protein